MTESHVLELVLPALNMKGKVPDVFTEFKSLINLDFSHNKLFGELPTTIGNIRSLKHLNIRNNGFTGQIPPSWTGLTKLETLSFGGNQLSGIFPPLFLCNLGNLRHLEFENMNIGGNLDCLAYCHKLESLRAANNKVTGELRAIADLPLLRVIRLNDNYLMGKLPESLFLIPGGEIYLDRNLLDMPSGSICAPQLALCEVPHCNTRACDTANATFLQENDVFAAQDMAKFNDHIWNESVYTLVYKLVPSIQNY